MIIDHVLPYNIPWLSPGHGRQVPDHKRHKDDKRDERDGKDEAIVPADYVHAKEWSMLIDDDIFIEVNFASHKNTPALSQRQPFSSRLDKY